MELKKLENSAKETNKLNFGKQVNDIEVNEEKELKAIQLKDKKVTDESEMHMVLSEDVEVYQKGWFTIMRQKNNWFGMYGKYKITKDYETKEQAIDDMERNDVNRLTTIINITIEIMQNKLDK